MKKKLGNLKINPERIIENDELINIKGGIYQCYCSSLGGWVTCFDKYELQMICGTSGGGWGGCA